MLDSQNAVYPWNSHCCLLLRIHAQILVHSCMNFEHVGNLLYCLQHIWALENRGFLKNCIFNKATYCEHVRNILRCFQWLPLRFSIRIRELLLRFSRVPHCLIHQQRHTSVPWPRYIKRCGRDLLLTTLLWKMECSILRGNLIPVEGITFSRADLTLEWTPEILKIPTDLTAFCSSCKALFFDPLLSNVNI